jgi:hypothetical protein
LESLKSPPPSSPLYMTSLLPFPLPLLATLPGSDESAMNLSGAWRLFSQLL